MKIISFLLFAASVVTIQRVFPQSSIVYESGTSVEVTDGADICADQININGTYFGSGTKCESALPVELITLSAIVERKNVTLRWKTATEVNNHGFEIQRSEIKSQMSENNCHPEQARATPLGGVEGASKDDRWQKVGFVEGNGTSNNAHEYSFTDRSNSAGTYAFRLKQIDRDGGFSYSEEVEMTVGQAPAEFTLDQNYPNPFNPATTIGFTLKEQGMTTLTIYDAVGKEAALLVNEVLNAGLYYSVTFNAKDMASGVYIARLSSGGSVQSLRMLLVK